MNWKNFLHRHMWTKVSTYINSTETYSHEHFVCKCGKHKHIKHYYGKQDIIRTYNLMTQK